MNEKPQIRGIQLGVVVVRDCPGKPLHPYGWRAVIVSEPLLLPETQPRGRLQVLFKVRTGSSIGALEFALRLTPTVPPLGLGEGVPYAYAGRWLWPMGDPRENEHGALDPVKRSSQHRVKISSNVVPVVEFFGFFRVQKLVNASVDEDYLAGSRLLVVPRFEQTAASTPQPSFQMRTEDFFLLGFLTVRDHQIRPVKVSALDMCSWPWSNVRSGFWAIPSKSLCE